jgi:hypothetical protein
MRHTYAVPALALFAAFAASPLSHAGPAATGSPRRLSEIPAGITSPTAVTPGLRLNEFLAGPARDWDGDGTLSTRDDEWVELVNTAGAPLDLSSFFLTDGDSIPRFAFSGTLDPGGRRLVFGSESYAWEKATGHPAFGLSLGNTGDQVILWQVVGADSLVVDRIAYLTHEGAADRAVGRVPDGTGEWTLLDALDPYTGALTPGATGCAPSPGSVNSCSATAARRVSWGGIKQMYR